MVQAIKNNEIDINDIILKILKDLLITNCAYDNNNATLVLDTFTGKVLRININDIVDGQVLLTSLEIF